MRGVAWMVTAATVLGVVVGLLTITLLSITPPDTTILASVPVDPAESQARVLAAQILARDDETPDVSAEVRPGSQLVTNPMKDRNTPQQGDAFRIPHRGGVLEQPD